MSVEFWGRQKGGGGKGTLSSRNDRENGMVEVTAGLVRKILADILPVSGEAQKEPRLP